jgi:hypothetical protein
MGEERNVCKVLVGKPEGRRPLRRPRRRREDEIRMDLREIGWGCRVNPVAQDRDWWQALVNMVKNLRFLVPQLVSNLIVMKCVSITEVTMELEAEKVCAVLHSGNSVLNLKKTNTSPL